MFYGFLRSAKALDSLFEEYGDVFPIENIEIPFISLLPDEANYRDIIKKFGFDNGIAALRKMCDAVVARQENDNHTLTELAQSEEFHIGVLRYTGAYTALRRGSRHFRHEVPEPVEDAATDFQLTTKLKNSENNIEVLFNFSQFPIFRERIAVLIGKNGVGKTQLLKSLINAHLNKAKKTIKSDEFSEDTLVSVSRILVFSAVPSDPFPRSLGAWLGIDYEYFSINSAVEHRADSLLASLVACRFEGGGHQNVLRASLKKMGLWSNLYLPLRKRKNDDDLPYVKIVDGLSYLRIGKGYNELDTLKAAQQIDWERYPVVLDDEGHPRELSSGEYAMMRFAAQIAAAIEPGSLLLLDEPEAHLHPNFISDQMEILYQLLKSTKSIAIIATHSAYVVREVPRENVKILNLEDGILSIDTPRMQTFGASIDTISQFIFGDTSVDHHFQKALQEWAKIVEPSIGIEGIIHEYGPSLNSESLSLIAQSVKKE